jgi:hypothetical protein
MEFAGVEAGLKMLGTWDGLALELKADALQTTMKKESSTSNMTHRENKVAGHLGRSKPWPVRCLPQIVDGENMRPGTT